MRSDVRRDVVEIRRLNSLWNGSISGTASSASAMPSGVPGAEQHGQHAGIAARVMACGAHALEQRFAVRDIRGVHRAGCQRERGRRTGRAGGWSGS